jgi:hypothetical protein
MRSSVLLLLAAAVTFIALGVFAQTGSMPRADPTGLGGAGPIMLPSDPPVGAGGFGGSGGSGGAGGFGAGGSGGGFGGPLFPDGGITLR